MEIKFGCYTNNEEPYIDVALFLKNGYTIKLDREKTKFTNVKGGYMDMFWDGLFIIKEYSDMEWSDIGDEFKEYGRQNIIFINENNEHLLKDAQFIHFEYEKAAPNGYFCYPTKIDGIEITYDKRIDILGTKDKGKVADWYEIEDEIDELRNHLTNNGYSYDLYKLDILLVTKEELPYIRTIMDERNLLYDIEDNEVFAKIY